MTENNLPIHPRERVSQRPVPLLDTRREVNFQSGRFFICEDELEFRINALCYQFLKMQAFTKFVRDIHGKIINQRVVCGDLTMFSDFLSVFLTKEFVDPKGMFRKICCQHPFEFLIMFDFLGYSCIKNDFGDFHVSLLQNEFFDLIGNSSFSYRIHLRCKCQREHFFYVLFYREHRFGSKFVSLRNFEWGEKCKCKIAAPQEVYNLCFSVRYILNFNCHKVCINELPDVFIDKVVPLDDYLKKIDCNPFFLS